MVGKTKNKILSPVIILTLQGTSKEQIQVALDNTLPEVSIMAPQDKENVPDGNQPVSQYQRSPSGKLPP